MKTLKKFFSILSKKNKTESLILLVLILLGVFFEMLSIGLLLPILTTLTNSENTQFMNFNFIFEIFNFQEKYEKKEIIIFFTSGLLIIYFVKTIFLNFLSWYQSKYINYLVAEIKYKLFKKYMYQDYTFHLRRNSSKLIQNIINESELMVNVFFQSFVTFTSELLVIFGISLILILIEPVGFIMSMTIFGTISIIFMKFTKKKVKKYGDQRFKNVTTSIKTLQQGVDGIKAVKLAGNELEFLNYFNKSVNKIADIATKMLILTTIPRFYLEFLAVLSLTGLIFFLLILNYSFSSLLVIVGLFSAAAFKILPSVNKILNSFVNMRYGLSSVEMIHKDLNMSSPKEEKQSTKNQKINLVSDIELKNISYKYPDNENKILNNVNLKIKAYSMVGIVGKSGSGKTTVIDLIIGILNTDSGEISVDGINIKNNKRLWQNNIGYIPQFIYLLDDTIKKNITLGVDDTKINNSKLNEALEKSQSMNFVENLSKKKETLVGEFGVRLSGGQRQRLGIARALYSESDLLVLDEATSSLDEETERGIINSLNSMKGKKTIIISSHKKEILNNCDVIYRVENNQIIKI
tara:strand:+ start:580 stop:2310 length:1731 start_codon:yes stop_codon:yes gene_type:complete